MGQTTVPTAKLNNSTDTIAANTAPSFAVGGIVTTKVSGSNDQGYSVAVQADGKILLGGLSLDNHHTHDFALVRYNSDGSLDTGFGGDGIVTTELGRADEWGLSVTMQTDGKILLSGFSIKKRGYDYEFALVRYNNDGSLDLSFAGDGKVTTDVSNGDDYGQSVIVQADGKILLGGRIDNSGNHYGLVRYNNDGSLDTDFGDNGKVTADLYVNYFGNSIAEQTDGKILLGGIGIVNNSTNDDFALLRYNTDGSLDTSFGGNGKVTTDMSNNTDYGYSVTVQADGKILFAGTSYNDKNGNNNFAIVRYNSDGSLDTSFGGDGIVTTDMGLNSNYGSYGNSVTVQADGKILLGGTSPHVGGSSSDSDFVLVRYNPDGSLDLSFDGDGKVITDEGFGNNYGSSVTVQADGKILLGGFSNYIKGNRGFFALVRYNSNGALDNSFNPVNTLNSQPSHSENSAAVVLDNTVQIYDAELAGQGNYNGASITLMRHGGANAGDVFSGSGLLSFRGSDAFLSGANIGTVSNSNGTLSIIFNSKATPARVDAVLSSIDYRNTTNNPPTPSDTSHPVQIDWIFNDGNTGTQGTGEALTATGSSIINILANYDELVGTTGNDVLRARSLTAKIYGFAGNDILYGRHGSAQDILDGGEGNDTLNGRLGVDSLLGGLGDDLYSVDRVSDVVIENLDEGTDTIISSSKVYNLPANVENLTLTGSHSIYGKGNDLANTLIGNDQDNRLTGGAGADTVSGGLGADIFKFNTVTETGVTETTRDSIVDFSRDQGDKINLAAIDANTALKGNNAFAAPTEGGAFSDTFANPGELYFDQSTNILYGNNDADSMADFSIKLAGVSSLAAEDFAL